MAEFSPRETATVLAALRYWQRSSSPHDDTGQCLDDNEIEELCRKINLEGAGPLDTAGILRALEQARVAARLEEPGPDTILTRALTRAIEGVRQVQVRMEFLAEVERAVAPVSDAE